MERIYTRRSLMVKLSGKGVGIMSPTSTIDFDSGHVIAVDFDRGLILDSAVKHAYTFVRRV
jgi:hypothetical protein